MRPYVHLAVRAHTCPVSVLDYEVASWLWERLRDAYPDALACSLMPNHVHTLVPGDVDSERRKLGRIVNGLRRSNNRGAAIRWEPASAKAHFTKPNVIARHVRYIGLNASRAELVSDPLELWWSTHRDVIGAVTDPWVPAARLAEALGRPLRGFAPSHHGYVSGDPSVATGGTAMPVPAQPTHAALMPIGEILAAACAATRSHPAAILQPTATRRVFIALGASQGWSNAKLLGRLCGITVRSTYRYLASGPPPFAALLCLGDARLRAPLSKVVHAFLTRSLSRQAG